VHGLVALMEIQSSRMRARLGRAGEPVPLLEQNRGTWDQLLIRRGFAALLTSVVQLNRAVAVGMAFGPARGLELADALTSLPELRNYHPLPTVRADFLAKLGRQEESRAEYTRAASLTRNAAERAVLLERAAACSPGDA
jgi:predicted RNA polymerase sigma factor